MNSHSFYDYIGESNSYEINDALLWDSIEGFRVVNVTGDWLERGQDITIELTRCCLLMSITGTDTRPRDGMNYEPCDRRPEGCCFEHSGCGYEQCAQHHPLQRIEIECDTYRLINRNIKHIRCENQEYSAYIHEFSFVLSDEETVPLKIFNDHKAYGISMHVRII